MQHVARMVKGWQIPGLAVAAAQDEVTSGDALLREIDGSANLAGVCHRLKDVDGHRIISPLVHAQMPTAGAGFGLMTLACVGQKELGGLFAASPSLAAVTAPGVSCATES